MKLQIFALVFAVCLVLSQAMPIEEDQDAEVKAVRHKRVTCDLMSAQAKGFAVNHSACAAHCLVLGKRGGYCSNGVCHCR